MWTSRGSVLETFVGMITPKLNTLSPVAAGLLALFTTFAMLEPISRAQDQSSARAAEDTRWLAIAPGEVEPGSGEIKIGSSVAGRIAEVLIKAKDRVFAGELLVRLEDDDLRARVKVAEAQAALLRQRGS